MASKARVWKEEREQAVAIAVNHAEHSRRHTHSHRERTPLPSLPISVALLFFSTPAPTSGGLMQLYLRGPGRYASTSKLVQSRHPSPQTAAHLHQCLQHGLSVTRTREGCWVMENQRRTCVFMHFWIFQITCWILKYIVLNRGLIGAKPTTLA